MSSEVPGYSQIFRGTRTNSSKRTHAALIAMKRAAASNVKGQKRRRGRMKRNKIEQIPNYAINKQKMIHADELRTMASKFYDNSDSHSKDTVSQLQLIDTTDGAIVYLPELDSIFSEKVPVLILLPRRHSINTMGKTSSTVISALDRLHVSEKSNKRSQKKTGQSTTNSSYSILGEKVLRGSHGVSTDQLSQLDDESSRNTRNTLVSWANRLEKLRHTVFHSSILRGLRAAYKLNDWNSLVGQNKHGGTYVSLATSKNYRAPAHVDKDFFLSLHQANVYKRGVYELNEGIVQYMCFPEVGIAVGLRPGDLLIFNPGTYHCLSEKETNFKDIDVHVSTFYIKTAHVGKNDNRLPLTQKEETLLN